MDQLRDGQMFFGGIGEHLALGPGSEKRPPTEAHREHMKVQAKNTQLALLSVRDGLRDAGINLADAKITTKFLNKATDPEGRPSGAGRTIVNDISWKGVPGSGSGRPSVRVVTSYDGFSTGTAVTMKSRVTPSGFTNLRRSGPGKFEAAQSRQIAKNVTQLSYGQLLTK